MDVFKNLDDYFEPCTNCGDCCHMPGDLLPEQVDILANHLRMNRKELFDRYLVVQLFAPNDTMPPAFLVSAAKVDQKGVRMAQKMVDQEYVDTHHLDCIFRDKAAKGCSVHQIKPFGCAFLICAKTTKANPVLLNKAFFYHRWIDSQDIIFSVYPALEPIHKQLTEVAAKLAQVETEKAKAVEERNRLSVLAFNAVMQQR